LAGRTPKRFLVCLRDEKVDEEIALGVLEERRRFERGDNLIGILTWARKEFSEKEEDLAKIYVLGVP
jgi:hypothetical protein